MAKARDKRIDGRLLFHDDNSGETKEVIFSVKGGHTDVGDVRDLRGVIDREKAQIGVLISLQQPTQAMKTEAASSGFYTSPWDNTKHPRLQLLTVEQLLNGVKVDMPPLSQVNVTFRRAPRSLARSRDVQLPLVDLGGDENLDEMDEDDA